MPGFLIIAHAPLASALQSVAAHTFPDARLEAFDVLPHMKPDEIEAAARELLDRTRNPDAIIFTDVFGASPSNVAQRLAGSVEGATVKVITGVNVPMLWRSLCYAKEPTEMVATRAITGAVQGVMQVATSRPQNQAFKPGGNDQDPDHHQQ